MVKKIWIKHEWLETIRRKGQREGCNDLIAEICNFVHNKKRCRKREMKRMYPSVLNKSIPHEGSIRIRLHNPPMGVRVSKAFRILGRCRNLRNYQRLINMQKRREADLWVCFSFFGLKNNPWFAVFFIDEVSSNIVLPITDSFQKHKIFSKIKRCWFLARLFDSTSSIFGFFVQLLRSASWFNGSKWAKKCHW